MNKPTKKLNLNDCWNQIGVWGNGTNKCTVLEQVIHCQNCNIYSQAGRDLLNRETPENYQEDWKEIYQNQKLPVNPQQKSVIVFRLGYEWFALPVIVLEEITDIVTVHSIPHRRNKVLRGMVNIRGTLQLCISLGSLFNVSLHDKEHITGRIVHERMLVVQHDMDKYVFPVSEVYNIHHYIQDSLAQPPATISRTTSTFIRGVIEIEDKRIGVIDADLLFHAIQRNIL